MGSPGAGRRHGATGNRNADRTRGRVTRARGSALRVADAEAGQSIILIIGMIALALLTISVVLAATAVNVQARKLLAVADGAVAAAADNFELDATGQADATLRLDPAEVRSAAGKYLDDIGAGSDFAELRIVSAGVQGDGLTAHLRLGATVHPPIVGWVVPAGVGISVESKARTLLSR
ncbi:hypothetical protein [Paeniglutamicibacter sp. NPDC091659]|uniref:hypothetical protein n=1 Tax=Paeniglutamicibacter sp. NPDC091659 TaxID=3364389 RepID=UPI00380D6409